MALTFPLSHAQFFDGITVTECTFRLPSNLKVSRTRGGAIRTAQLGPRLWSGRLVLAPETHAQAARIEARLERLTEPGASFLAYPLPLSGPISDPTGATLAGYDPTLHALQPGGREIRLAGLPPGFELAEGDMIGWTYGSNPTRYALHRLVSDATASAAGITPLFEVVPPVRPGVSIGAAVSLVTPSIKAVLVPGQGARAIARVVDGLEVEFVQTLG